MRKYSDYLFYCLIFSIPVIFVLGAFYYQGHHTAEKSVVKVIKPSPKPTSTVVAKKSSVKKIINNIPQLQLTATPELNKSDSSTARQAITPTPIVAQPHPTQQLHTFDQNANQADTNPGQSQNNSRVIRGAVKLISSLLPL